MKEKFYPPWWYFWHGWSNKKILGFWMCAFGIAWMVEPSLEDLIWGIFMWLAIDLHSGIFDG